MRKIIFFFFLTLIFLFSASPAHAAIIVINKTGDIVWNVLGTEQIFGVPKISELSVKSIASVETAGTSAQVSINKQDGKFELNVTENGQNKSLDVSNVKGGIIEVQERPQTKSIKIGLLNDKFSLQQDDIIALTNFPISISPKDSNLSVLTESGYRYLTIFPKDAFSDAVRAKVITKIKDDNFTLEESSKGELSYSIGGVKTINIFNIVNYDVPVKAIVSATTGEILSVDQPLWFRIFGFIFS